MSGEQTERLPSVSQPEGGEWSPVPIPALQGGHRKRRTTVENEKKRVMGGSGSELREEGNGP